MRNPDYEEDSFKEIIDSYEEAIEKGEHIFLDADDLADLADYYYSHNNLEQADEVSRYASSLYPDSTIIKILQVNTLLNINNDLVSAKNLLEQIEDTSALEYIYVKADILLREKKVEEAHKYLQEQECIIDKEELENYYLDITELCLDNEFSKEALFWLQKCKNKSDDDYNYLFARLCFNIGDYTESIKILTELVDNHPYDDELWCLLAKAQHMNFCLQDALTSCDYSIAIEPEKNEAVFVKGVVVYARGDYKQAIELLKQYTEWFPDAEKANEYLGYSYMQIMDYKEAAFYLEKALELKQSEDDVGFELYFNLAFAHSGLHNLDKAIKYANKIPFDNDEHYKINLIKGHICLENDNLENAMLNFQSAINQADNKPEVITETALSLYDNNYIEKAYKIMEKLMNSIKFDYPKGEVCMAMLAYRTGRRNEYLERLKKGIEMDKDLTRDLLFSIFPENMDAEDFYEFAKKYHLK